MGLNRKTGQLLVALLALATSARATITVTARGTQASNAASVTTWALSPTTTLAVGSTGVICLGLDNANGSSINVDNAVITDSVGNSWRFHRGADGSQGTNAGAEAVTVVSAPLTHALTSSNTVTVTFTNAVTAKTAAFWELAPTSGNQVLPLFFAAGTYGASFSASATPTVTSTNLVSIGNVVMGAIAAESADTFSADDTDTTNGTWSTSQHTGVGAGASGMSLITQCKVQTTTAATQTFDGTLTAADGATLALTFVETSAKVRSIECDATSATATNISPKMPIAVGSMAVLCMASDNHGTNGNTAVLGTSSVTDTGSNTWTRQVSGFQDPGAADAGVEIAIYTSPITTGLAIGDNVTVTYAGGVSVTAKAAVLFEFAPAWASGAVTFVSGAAGTGAATTTPTQTTASVTSGNIVVAMAGCEGTNSWTDDADTTNGVWQFGNQTGFTSGTSGIAIIAQRKTVNATATQSFDPTQGAANDTELGYVILNDSSPSNAAAFLDFF